MEQLNDWAIALLLSWCFYAALFGGIVGVLVYWWRSPNPDNVMVAIVGIVTGIVVFLLLNLLVGC